VVYGRHGYPDVASLSGTGPRGEQKLRKRFILGYYEHSIGRGWREQSGNWWGVQTRREAIARGRHVLDVCRRVEPSLAVGIGTRRLGADG